MIVGCGLDARRQRLGRLAETAVFYELDIEEVIDVRRKLMPALENEQFIVSSTVETKWMDELVAKHPNGNFIFIIEGVLMYFGEADNTYFLPGWPIGFHTQN